MPYKDPVQRRRYNRKYQKEYYEKNKAKRRAEVQARRKGIRKWFEEIRREAECEKCGLKGADCPWLLDYHHRKSSEKENSVSYLVNNGYSKERILAEIAKCDVLCANHHRQHHWKNREKERVFSRSPKPIGTNTTAEAERRQNRKDRKLEQQTNRARATGRLPDGYRLPGPNPADEEE